MSNTSLFGRFSTFGASCLRSRGYNTKLSDREAGKPFGNMAARGKEPNSSDQSEEPNLRQEGDIELQRPARPHGKAF